MAKPQQPPVLRLRRLFTATPQEVFAAWIDPVGMKEWMCPAGMSVTALELEPQAGGRFRLVMRDGLRDIEHTGEYREVQPPRKLAFTWRSPGTYGQETLVTVELIPHGTKTELVLTHEWLPDAVARKSHTRGWQSIMEKFDAYLKPAEACFS
ncbi:MAG: SRPBCC domain-containing protein [Deltaproteobacteria bacterium]|nr:SRPBCC domain-containing protein [Deltaproteobacteria bacterium]